MKKLFIGVACFLLIAFLVVVAVVGKLKQEQDQLAAACESSSGGTALNVSSLEDLTVKGVKMTPEQRQNAATIAQVALENALPPEAVLVAMVAAMQESELINVAYGDRDSIGLFQQRDHWGSRRARMDPPTSSYMFYFGGRKGYSEPGLTDIDGWQQMSPGDAAQAVQVSAFPVEYAKHQPEAEAIVEALTGEGVESVSAVAANYTAECPTDIDPIEEAVQAALSRQGDSYEWADEDGSGLVSWAFGEAGIPLPETFGDLSTLSGQSLEGVEAEAVSIDSPDNLQRGDIVTWRENGNGAPMVGIDLGDVSGTGTVRFASFNIKGSFRGTDWQNRLRRTTDLLMNPARPIDVAGLQELKQDQRALFLTDAFGGKRYDMYPARYKGKNENYVSENSIIWDKSKFSLVSAEEILFMRNYEGADRKLPQLLLEVKATGQRFYVLNTHDPAFAHGAARRYANAKFYKAHLQELSATGLPIIFTGDFNAGYKLKETGNVTLDDDIDKLTYCVLTSGVVWDTFDAVKNETGVCPSRNGGAVDHIFVSRTLSVTSHEKSAMGYGQNGSDHPMISADVQLPGAVPDDGQPFPGSRSIISRDGTTVNVVTVRPGELVRASRLTVKEEIALVAHEGDWAMPMRKGTYTPPQSSGGMYGFRIHPVTGVADFHNGVDLGASTGADLFSIGDGEVVKAEYHSCWGNLVIVDHGEYLSMYTHLSQFAAGLSVGSTVQAGQQIGDVGNTGSCTTGSHLHFTVGTSLDILSGSQAGSVDPVPFMAARNVPLY